MRTWLTAVALALLAVPAVLGVGCGGGDEEGPSATAVPVDRPTLEAMLGSVALTLADLPAGFVLEEPGEVFTDNEEAAETDPEGKQAALARFNDWGRLLGYEATYMTNDPLGTFINGGTALVSVSLNIFQTAEGAAAGIEWGRQVAADPSQSPGLFPGVIAIEGETMSFPTVGDETLAARFNGTLRPEDAEFEVDVDFVAHLVAIRRGRATAHIIVAAIGGATPGQEVEDIIRTLDQRLAQALQ
ncbi:MAG: hypothetical protein AMJ76_00905 [Dehalococcoidia bacterium SM23_28_1]|nr:MAG: hypothetical protein AMJ76_00905 [Dehalococcoidia bacterium SM23_28_1]